MRWWIYSAGAPVYTVGRPLRASARSSVRARAAGRLEARALADEWRAKMRAAGCETPIAFSWGRDPAPRSERIPAI
jgi:hypothetical protein